MEKISRRGLFGLGAGAAASVAVPAQQPQLTGTAIMMRLRERDHADVQRAYNRRRSQEVAWLSMQPRIPSDYGSI